MRPPLLPTLRPYQGRWLRPDLLAGVAAGTVVIPQAMAYATIAGLPVEVGLYTCMLPMVVYALVGGSRSLSISTTSTIAILTAATLALLPGDRPGDDLLRDAFTLTLLVGACLLAMRLFRLGSLVEQISPATMTGVKAGVGLTVAATQLPTLLGVSADPEREGFFGSLADALSKLDDVNTATLAVSATAVVSLVLLRRLAPQVPAPLVVSGGAILVVAMTDLASHGVALVAPVPRTLPTPTAPVWHDIGTLLPGAAAIAIMAFMETVLVARAQRQRSEPAIDADQELLANGLAALAGGLSQSMPPAGGFSQSAVNQRAGARSQLAGITTAVLAVLVALLLGPVLEDLPQAVLASMVLVAVIGLVSVAAFRELFRIDRAEFWVAVVTAGIGLTAGLLEAVAVGVLLTLVLVLRALNRPRIAPLHRREGGGWTLIPPAPGSAVTDDEGVLVLHLLGSLYTGSARPTQDAVLATVLARDPRPRMVVLEGAEVTTVTMPLLEVLEQLAEDLRREDIPLVLAAWPEQTVARARGSHWFASFADAGGVQPTVDLALAGRERGTS